MSPVAWAALHPVLLGCLMGISFLAGALLALYAVAQLAPERDLLRERGLR